MLSFEIAYNYPPQIAFVHVVTQIEGDIVLILGFAMMAMSGYKPNYEVGQLTAIIIALAFLLDFLLLPALLLKFDADEATSTEATPMDDGATTAA